MSPWTGHSSVDGIQMGASAMRKMRNVVPSGLCKRAPAARKAPRLRGSPGRLAAGQFELD